VGTKTISPDKEIDGCASPHGEEVTGEDIRSDSQQETHCVDGALIHDS